MKLWFVVSFSLIALAQFARADSLPADTAARPRNGGAGLLNDPAAQSALLFTATRTTAQPPGPRLPAWVGSAGVDLTLGTGTGSNVGDIGFGLRTNHSGVTDYTNGAWGSISSGTPGWLTDATLTAASFDRMLSVRIQGIPLPFDSRGPGLSPQSSDRAVTLAGNLGNSTPGAGAGAAPTASMPGSGPAAAGGALPPVPQDAPAPLPVAAAPYRRKAPLPSIWWVVAYAGAFVVFESVQPIMWRQARR